MKATKIAISLLLLCLALPRYVLAANVVHMTMSRSKIDMDSLRRDFSGGHLRRNTIPSDLFNNMTDGAGYLVNVKVGTPGQALSLIIDTGSSDTFVLANTDDQCNDPAIIHKYGPCAGGTFNPSSSSTFTTVAAGGFKVKYLDQSQSAGDYITDNFEIGGSLVSSLQMGLALHSTVGVGIMGIGYQTGESVTAKNRYPNLVDQLVAQKLINLKAYSLYLDDKETSSGSVLFGGIDTEKFIGTLKVLPIQKDSRTNILDSFVVLMTSLSVTNNSGTSNWSSLSISLPVVLDSGTTLTYLPSDLVSTIITRIGAVDDTDTSKLIFVDCDWRTTRPNDFLSFGFGGSGGPVIRVPLSEFIRTIHGHYADSPFQKTCDLGIRAANSSTYLLGDTFLRSAYVVYDLDHNQIALAQTNFEAPGSKVHEIPSGASGIPLLSGQATGLTQVPESHFTTITTSSSRTSTQSATTGTAGASRGTTSGSISAARSGSMTGSTSTGIAVSTSGTASGTIAISTSPGVVGSTSTQNVSSTASSATSKSAATTTIAAFQKEVWAVLIVSTLTACVNGFWLFVL